MSWCVLSGFPVSPIWPLTSAERVIRTERYAGIDFRVARTTSNLLDRWSLNKLICEDKRRCAVQVNCMSEVKCSTVLLRGLWCVSMMMGDTIQTWPCRADDQNFDGNRVMQAYEEMLFLSSMAAHCVVQSHWTSERGNHINLSLLPHTPKQPSI